MKPPPIEYAKGHEGKVAFQTLGDGPLTLVFMPFLSRFNLDIIWEHAPLERYLRRLASFSRLILFNPRGTGISDPMPLGAAPLAEDHMLDLALVVDAVGSERVSMFAHETAAPVAILFGATFPERTDALALLNPAATLKRADDYPWGFPPETLRRFSGNMIENWGTGRGLEFSSPEFAGDDRFRDWWARLERLSASPTVVFNTESVARWDVRGVLRSVKSPTLVISHTHVPWIRPGHGRYIAENITDARYVERDGSWGDVFWGYDVDWTLDEVQAFLTGRRGSSAIDDRVLATVLFTDIVGSTERAAELGDARWRELLDEHDTLVRGGIERFRGRAVTSTGDGVLATFDGPARAIRCAIALNDDVRELGIEIRTGLHTGEVEKRGDDVSGIAVHIGARVMSLAGPGEILVSGSVPPLVAGSGLEFDDRGSHELKGVPGEWRLYAVKA